jgi:hypothetical protein
MFIELMVAIRSPMSGTMKKKKLKKSPSNVTNVSEAVRLSGREWPLILILDI